MVTPCLIQYCYFTFNFSFLLSEEEKQFLWVKLLVFKVIPHIWLNGEERWLEEKCKLVVWGLVGWCRAGAVETGGGLGCKGAKARQ